MKAKIIKAVGYFLAGVVLYMALSEIFICSVFSKLGWATDFLFVKMPGWMVVTIWSWIIVGDFIAVIALSLLNR